VPVGGGVETTPAHYRHAERVGNASELWHHAARFADHDQPCRLSDVVVKREALRHAADGRHELFGALPMVWLGDGAAVITNDVHRDDTRTPGAVEMFTEALISTFRLLVVVGTDQTVEDLTNGQWQVVDILAQHTPHLVEQCQRRFLRRPGRETAHTGTHALHPAE
jgi:hypothetical protein